MKKKWKDCFPCRGKYVKIFRIMKLCTCLLFCSMMTLSAGVRGQHIKMSLDMKGVTLEEVIWTLEKKSDITFFYNVSDVSKVTNVSAVFKDASLEAILDMLLKGTNLYYEIQNRVVVIKSGQPMSVQDSLKGVTVKGVVKDSRGGMLPGVTVVLKGTTTGVATGISGDFVITIPKRDSVTLLFSFVGMKTKEVKWRGQTELTVVLEEDMNEMEEVVITGYQVIDRRKSTSAVSSVKMEDIMIPGVSTLDKMLEGQIPDLMVMTNSGESGVAPKIRIRGTSTLIGNREPLWVIDGVIVQDPVQISPDELNDPDYINRIGNAISGINPQDIERIDVLKDASATALYGTKAANGVIVITTKRGHVGEPQISYRGTATLKLRPRYSDRNIDLMNAKERLNVSRELAEAGYQYATSVTWVGYEKLLRELYNRTISYEEFEKQVAYLGKENTDWFKLLTRDAFSSSHTVSVTGGTEKVRYYSSVGVNIEEDVVKPNLDRRYTGTLNLDMNFTPWLAASFNVNANTSKRKYYQEEIAPINYAYNTSRAIPAYTEEGKYSFYLIPSGFSYYDYNILNELENSSKRQEGSSVTFRANLDVKPWEWLKISTILSYSVANTDIEGYWGTKTYHAALIRRSADEAGADETSGMPRGGELTVDKSRNKSYMFRLQADLNRYWGVEQQHNINASVGMETNSTKYDAYKNITRGYDPERGKQFIVVDPTVYTSYANWMSENVPVVTDNLSNMLSWYGSISYSYGNWFTVNANVRYDGSNQFGERSNDKLLPIWSASFNYNVMEHFKGEQDWFDDLRLKMSYGYQDVGRMGRDAECGHALAHVVRIGKAEMLLGRHVAEHRRARPRDHGAADGGRDVVVARTDVAHERPERVEGRVIAPLALIELVELDAGHRNVAGPLDHHLHVASTRPAVELPERPEFGELRRIVAVVEAARAQAVAERERQVVVRRNVEDLVKVLVEEVLPAEGLHPPGHHAASSGDDARQAAARKLDVGQEEPCVDRHVVDARPGLVLQDVPEDLPGERERIAACALERFVKRHGADGHGRAAQDHLAGLADAPAGREVHHGVRASGERLLHLAAFLAPVGGRGGSADIGVDLGGEVAADDGGLDLGMREGGGLEPGAASG